MTERWETPEGVEVLVDGDAAVARRALARGTALTDRALGFLRGWLHAGFGPDRGEFALVTLEVPASREDGRGDVVLRFVFTLHADPHEYGYTWFEVSLNEQDPRLEPWWPVGCAIGFW